MKRPKWGDTVSTSEIHSTGALSALTTCFPLSMFHQSVVRNQPITAQISVQRMFTFVIIL